MSNIKQRNRRTSEAVFINGLKVVENYSIVKELGKGYNAKVKLVQNRQTNQLYAMKIFNTVKLKRKDSISLLKKDSIGDITKEVEILKQLNHPNIIKLEEFIEEQQKSYVILEYADGGCLQDLIDKNLSDEHAIKKLFLDLLTGLNHLHS